MLLALEAGELETLNRESGTTIVLVTHEPDIAAHARRIIVLRDGVVSSDERRSAFVEKLGLPA